MLYRVGEQLEDTTLISDAAQIVDEVNTSSSSTAAAATETEAGDAERVASHSDAADVRLAGLPTASESSSVQILCGIWISTGFFANCCFGKTLCI